MRNAGDHSAQRRRLAPALAAAVALSILWAALAPLHLVSRERAIDIAAGNDALPAAITLTLGVQDVLLLRNVDHVAQRFGPVLLAPGEQIRLPFEQAGVYPVAAGAWPDKTLTVTVVEWPAPGWERLGWRLAALSHAVRYLPRVAPAMAMPAPAPARAADRAPAPSGSGIMPA